MDIRKLKKAVAGEVYDEDEVLSSVQSDFGGMIRKKPQAVVVPRTVQDVQNVVRLANQNGWEIGSRGGGHSQSGQSLSRGILLDMTGLNRIDPVDRESVWVDGGVFWDDLVKMTLETERLSPVLTSHLRVTVGGTVSSAGLGAASHRWGMQADTVEGLEVVTGEGHRIRCSAHENVELFDCVRCGLGQFAVITRARLKLRKAAPAVRTWFLLYDDLEVFLRDQERLVSGRRFDFIESWCTPCVQGFKKLGEAHVPLAEWFYAMQVTTEFESDPPEAESQLAGLHYCRRSHVEDRSISEFLHRQEPLYASWRQTGAWNLPHPWMEVVLPWNRAAGYIQGVLKNFPADLLAGGQVVLRPCRGSGANAALFGPRLPASFVGFGILPAVPRRLVSMAVALLGKAGELAMQIGGRRLLNGWVEFDHAGWRSHFGDTWPKVLECKKFFDPKGVLNPGFIRYTP